MNNKDKNKENDCYVPENVEDVNNLKYLED